MRSQLRTYLIVATCSLSIALYLFIPAGPASRPFARTAEKETKSGRDADAGQAPGVKYDRIESKYDGGKYVGDKYYRDGKLVKETTTRYHQNSDKVERETTTEYHPDSNGQYKTKEEETTYRRDGTKSSNTVTEYGGVNNVQKRRKKTFIDDGFTIEDVETYEPGGNATDEDNRIKTRDRTVTDKNRRVTQVEHYEWSDDVGPRRMTGGYTQFFEYPDDNATQPSKKKEEHYEVGENGRGEWKPGLLPKSTPKSSSKSAKSTPAPTTPKPATPPKKTLKSEILKSILGVVRPTNILRGEKTTVSVVTDPDRYESIPGLKVLKQEVQLPVTSTGGNALTEVVVDTGDGLMRRADKPIPLEIHGNTATLTLKKKDDQSLLARFDLPTDETLPISDETDLPDSALKPGEEKVRKSREEAYRRALRRATESDQDVEEARKAKTAEEDLAKIRRQAQKNREQADDAAKNVPEDRRRAIQKEEAEEYRRTAKKDEEEAKKKRDEAERDRRNAKQAQLPSDQKDAVKRAEEADKKAAELEKEAKRKQDRARALDELSKSQRGDATGSLPSYRMPPVARDGGVQVVVGRFDGLAAEQDVMIDGRLGDAFVVAESTRMLFFRLKDGTTAGMHRFTLREGSKEFQFPLCVLNLSLSADQLNLLRGQSTQFRAVVSGPESLPASAWREMSLSPELWDLTSLRQLAPEFRVPSAGERGSILFVIENKSRDTVTIGQEVVVLRLEERDFKNGPYRFEGRITARKSGGFTINGTVAAFLAPIAEASSGLEGRSESEEDEDSKDPSVSKVPQDPDAKFCKWYRYTVGKDTIVTKVTSDKPKLVEVRLANLSGSGGFEYHCLATSGTALITYKYTDANGGNEQEKKLRVFCNPAD